MRKTAGRKPVRPRTQKRRVALVLHAHLPDCRRPSVAASLEETWFFEAMTGSYLPLIEAFERLASGGVRAPVTLSISPPLLLMMQDSGLLQRYRIHLEEMSMLAQHDAREGPPGTREAAAFHAAVLAKSIRALEAVAGHGGLARVWMRLQRLGVIDLATTAASHAFLPAHQTTPEIIHAQVAVALDCFREAFKSAPGFFWLPECGFFPGLDSILAQHGITSFAVEEQALRAGEPPAAGPHLGMRCPGGPVALGRHAGLSELVWSSKSGYPGNPRYREFHFDHTHAWNPDEVTRVFGHPLTMRPAGLKYWRVTGSGDAKESYEPETASQQARADAEHFTRAVESEARPGVCLLPFDAELFGHWWFEGPQWLEETLRLLSRSDACELTTVSDLAASTKYTIDGMPAASTWGRRADNSFWVTHETAWVYPQLAALHERLAVALDTRAHTSLEERALQRAAQLLLLAEASDWPFIISSGAVADLAMARLKHLLESAGKLLLMAESGTLDENVIAALESSEPAYGTVDLRHFARMADL